MKKLSKNLAMYILYFGMFVAVFCAMTLKAEAANVTTGKLGDNNGITWTYDADTKTLTITGEDSGLNGKWDSSKGKFRSPFAAICADVEVIKVQNCTLKGSTKAMFANLGTLKRVEFSNVNTSGVTDMTEMFSGCSKLSSVDVSQFDTSNVTNMKGMFYNCSSLSSLDVSKFNTSKVTDMSIMFYSCSSLGSLDVSKFDTSKVTDMSHMFYCCSKLSGLDVSKFNTSNVTNMRNMFSLCGSLSGLDVSGFNTSKVTNMYEMFRDCAKLSSLNVSNFDTSNVTTMLCMFGGCSGLSSLDLSNFNTSKVTNMCNMFYGCYKLSSLDVSKFNTSNVTSMQGMFYNCSSLSSLNVSNFNTSKVTNIGQMFNRCSVLKSLDMSSFDLTNVTDVTYMFKSCNSLVCIETPKTIPETLSIDLPGTYANSEGKRTTKIAKDFSGTTLIHVNYLVSKINLNASTLTVQMGKSGQLTASVSPTQALNKTVTWKSSNTAVATVDANGKVTAVAPGTATITATAKDGTGVSASCEVTVIDKKKYLIRAFVERMYTVALGRAAEADGLDFYTERLLAGDSNGACLAESFLCSPEFVNKGYDDAQYVKVLYKTFFDRDPAAEEVNYWVGLLSGGKSRAFVLAGFVNSVEFDNLCASYGISRGFMLEDGKPINPGIGRFAERLYTVILERAGEKEGIEYWSLQMAKGVCTPKDAAKNFFLSPEYVNKNTSDAKYITTLYRTFMDREPEEGGVEYWQNVLNNGATREQILEGFADSAEFKGIMTSFGL